jgi:Flp pilus assembly protein TadD
MKQNKATFQKSNFKQSKESKEPKKENSFLFWGGLLSVVFLGMIIYSNSFDCSFQFDDKHNILTNGVIRSLTDLKAIWDLSSLRFVPFYSFAINYHFGKFDVGGYHLVNLIIHLINSGLVMWLTSLLFSSPGLKDHPVAKHKNSISFLMALLFVSHPLATGSVTYIVQRMASMVAMFYFLSIGLYMKARLSETKSKYLLFAGSSVFAILAFLSKENSFTLPIAIVLIELLILNSKKIAINIKDYRVIGATLVFLILGFFVMTKLPLEILKPILPSKYNFQTITSENYFYTQLGVILKYIQLLIFPINQNIDHDITLSNSFFEIKPILSSLVLLSLIAIALFNFDKNKIISFGILWFFITISIESSFIPINDLAFEHRTYIPSFGFFLILTCGAYQLFWDKHKNTVVFLFTSLILVNSVLSYNRNKVWKDEISLWSDAAKKSPNKVRPFLNRGYAYGNIKEWDNAITDFNRVNEIEPKFHAAAYYNLGLAYWTRGQKELSVKNYSLAIEVDPKYDDAYYGRGTCYFYLNQPEQALADYNKTIEVNNKYDKAYTARGILNNNLKRYDEAIADYSKAIEINPVDPSLYNNRAMIYGTLLKWNKAIEDLSKVIELEPQNSSAISKREYAYSQLKNMK